MKGSNDINEYVEFCCQQKHKSSIISTNAFIIELYKSTHYINISFDKYVTCLIGLLNDCITGHDIYHTDLLLHLLIDLVKYSKTCLEQHIDFEELKKKLNFCQYLQSVLFLLGF